MTVETARGWHHLESRPPSRNVPEPQQTRLSHSVPKRRVAQHAGRAARTTDVAVLAFFAIVGGLATAQLYVDHCHTWWIVGGIVAVALVLMATESL